MLLEKLTDAPDEKLADIEMVGFEERKKILVDFNDSDAEYPKEKTIVDLFEEQVEKTPDNIAVVFEEESLTYAELNKKADQVANILRSKGVKHGDYVAMFIEKSLEMIVGIYGILKAGGVYVPINTMYPEDRVEYILNDCKAEVLLCGDTELNISYQGIRIDLKHQDWNEISDQRIDCDISPEDGLYVIYTSGTTGKPKGVEIMHKNVVRLMFNDHFDYDFNEKDVWTMFHSYGFDFSVWEMYGATLYGGKLVVVSEEEAKDSRIFLKLLKRHKVTVLNQVPTAFYNLDREDKGEDLAVRYLIFGGEALNPSKLRNWKNKHPQTKIINMYGITETTVHVTYREIGEEEIQRGISDIGRAIPTLKVYMMQGDSLCGIGVPGELCVVGDGLARGYLNRPDLTDSKFVKNPFGEGRMYRSGDLGRWLPDGNIEYLGRIDEQVKIRGFRIELGEIETRIRELREVKDCAVIARADSTGEKTLFAYVVGDEKIDFAKAREELKKTLPDYMIPSYMMRIDSIPITRNGKLDRRALPEIKVQAGNEYVAPRNETEEKICSIFSEILNVEKVSIKDSFFALGGHSLRATRLVNRIEAETGTRIALKDVFSHPTPEQLAERAGGKEETRYTPIPKAEEKEYYPMSSAQKRTYLICQMDPDGILYNMPENYRLYGDVDADKLKDALQQMLDRHEILRTQFLMVDGEPVQKILSHVDADFEAVSDADTSEEELISRFIRPFDLSKLPLVRIQLVDRGDHHLLNIDMHHIVGDGMSVGTFIKELNAIYNGEELPALTHQFKDYSEWMRERDLSYQEEYWKGQFEEEIPVLDMPLDFVRPQEQSYSGSMVIRSTGKELGEKIRKIAAETGTTEFMVLLSAAMVLLSKYSRQEDIVIGSPFSGRTHKDTESMLGMFINTLAMRGRPEGKKTYQQFLSEIKETCLKAYENQEYPFEELVEVVDVVRDMSRNPLFDVMLILQNNEEAPIRLNGAKAEYAAAKDTVAKLDLAFNIWEQDGGYGIGLEYCTALFKEESAKAILDHFIVLLETLTTTPEVKLSQVDMLSESERAQILSDFNDTEVSYPQDKTFVELFEEQVRKTPENIAVVFEGQTVTYLELNERANQLAHMLRERFAIKPGDFIAMLTERSIEMLVGIFGILKAGGAYVPMDPTYPEERIAYMLCDSKPKAVLTYNTSIETDLPVIDLKEASSYSDRKEDPSHVNKPEDLAYCIYTSGTTGKPKGVLIEQRGVNNLASYMRKELDIGPEDHAMLFSNYIFDGSVFEMLLAIANGAALYVPTDECIHDIDAMRRYVSENDINISYFPPQYYEQGRFPLSKYVVTAGSSASMSVVSAILENCDYINSYGPTEATVCVSNWILEKGSSPERITIGKPLSNAKVYIVQGDMLCGIGVPGELCVSGAGLARGYLNLPELTSEKFVKNPFDEGRMYHTGDLARWLPDGTIEYLGRIDEQVKIRGFRVELGEIESRIREIGNVRDCAVIARADERGEKSIYAYVVGQQEIRVSEVREELAKTLPDYMIPSYLMQIEKIPMTRNGKLDKRALPDIEAKTSNEYVAPRTAEEEALCEAFQTMLGAEKVGVKDSFFELGGDSIKAIRVVSGMRSKGYMVAVKDILNRRTPENIALYVSKAETGSYEQGEVTGLVIPTPMMRQFKAWNMSKPWHFNQAVMIPVDAETKVIRKALDELIRHHDILRAVYNGDTLEILSFEKSKKYGFSEYDVRGHEHLKEEVNTICTGIQESIDLSSGPLMKTALFNTDAGMYLLICIHHFAVDGVSWRILLEDLQTAMEGYAKDLEVKLPAKSASFIEWSKAVEECRTSGALQEEKKFWEAFENKKEELRLAISEDERTEEINGTVSFELSEQVTEDLLRHAGRAYNTRINDLLLAALGMAVGKLTGQAAVSVALEGHGREKIHKPISIDRTIGWFTTQCPVILNCKEDLETSIVDTKDMLHEIPNNGIGYGILHDTDLSSFVDIFFNYLGEMDSENSTERKADISLPQGECISSENRLPGIFAINAYVENKRFVFPLTYNNCTRAYAERFMELYESALKQVISWCKAQTEVHITESDMYSLTPLQEGMYFHNQLNPEDSSYKLQSFFKASRRIDPACLKVSLDCLCEKYEVLKTGFSETKTSGAVRQYIVPDRHIEIGKKKIEESYSDAFVSFYSSEDLKRGFDLKKDPLMRVAILSFSDCDVLFVSSHHIVMDGWCNNLIFGDLTRFYNLCLSGKEKADVQKLAEDEKRFVLPFKEYVEWIHSIKKSDLEKFWEDYLEDYDSVSEITPLEPVIEKTEIPIKEEMLAFDLKMTEKLQALAKRCDATISTVCQLATGLLLQKHCGTDDVLVGNVVSGRNAPLKGIENAVGMFINTIPLRIRAEKDETMESMLRHLQTMNSESNSYDHASLSDIKIAGRNVSDYIRHLFVFENYPEPDEESIDGPTDETLTLQDLYAREQTNYDFFISAFIMNDCLIFKLSYDPGKYASNDILRIRSHLETIVRQIAEKAETKVRDITVCDDREREIVLNRFNDTATVYPKDKTIAELFEEQVEKTPEKTAVVFGETSLSYSELNEKANRIGHLLREKYKVAPNDHVAILADRSVEIVVGILGILKAGGAYVPIDPNYPDDRKSFILEDCSPKAVLMFNTGIKTEIPVIDLSDRSVFEGSSENPKIVNGPEDLIYCIYTSGTTGKPKGSEIEQRNVVRLVKNTNYAELNENTVILQTGSMSFDASTLEVWGTLLNGGRLVLTDLDVLTDSRRLKETIEKQGITTMWMTSTLFNQMIVTDRSVFDGLKHLLIGGEKLSDQHVRMFKDRKNGVKLTNGYGPTENTTFTTTYEIPDDFENIPIGKPIANTTVYIMQGDTLCGIGVPGELCTGGDGVGRGYLNRPELTSEKFVKNPFSEGRMYRTGDLVRWLPDGNIEFLGRIDDQVKIRGFRIELGEIESRIREIEKVKDSAVIVREDANGEKAIYAYYVSEEDLNASEIRDKLGKTMPDYMIPSYMMRIESIPVTRNGKLDKRALPEIEVKTENEYVAPKNETEEVICRIFSEILNVEKVSIKDSFFALGGHSLRATRLVNRIEAETGTRIALKEVFSHPTPEQLADLVGGKEETRYTPIPKAEEKEYYPMSSAQKRTYLICQRDPDGVLYNMPQNLRLKGQVRPEELKNALQGLLDRHEILRTQFLIVDGEPVQKILSHVEAEFEYLEDKDTPEEELLSRFVRPFDLSKPPLVRMLLIERGDHHLLSIDIHHIIGDGMSVGTFFWELCALYNGETLVPLTHQFKDYSEWMRRRDLSSQEEYWKSQFEEEIPVLDMPLDFVRPQEQSYSGSMVFRNTGKDLGQKIKDLAEKTESTEFMVLLSAAMVLLSKYSRQEDIVIGSPISGRTHKDTEEMLGMFVNTLAMRGRPEGNKSYLEFLSEIKETCLKAYENQEYPFEELVEVVDVVRDMSRNPLFDVMLVLQNNEETPIRLNGAEAEYADAEDTVAKLDLTFNIWEQDGEYGIGLEYCTALFTEESAKAILDHFVVILEKLASAPESRIAQIEMLSESERTQILSDFNDTEISYPKEKTFVELFEEQVRKTPENIAVVFEDQKVTYRELNEKANQLAHVLRERLAIRPGDFVAMLTERSIEMLVGIFGILKAGGAYVPMDPTYPEERIRYMLEDAKPKAILTYKTDIQTEIPVLDLEDASLYQGNAEDPEHVNKPEDLAYCIYTSGTTGNPKGVLIEHRNMNNLVSYLRSGLDIAEEDHVMLFANYIFDGSVWEILSAIMNGASLYIPTDETIRDIDSMKDFVSENGISVSYFPPQYYEQGRFALSKYVITAGSSASMSVVKSILENCSYINSYGPTEATVSTSNWILEKGSSVERITIGRPISNAKVYIVQGDMLCGIGVPGELCVSGAGLARGYLNLPDLTSEKFVKDPFDEGRMYRTGDLTRWLPDGNIEYLGRIDEQVKIRGFRVEIGEIESRIRAINNVTNCAVIARSDAKGEKSLYAYVVAKEDIRTSEIREELAKSLPDYMIPSYLMQIENLPMTRNGKLDKRALPDIEVKSRSEYVAPRNAVERILADAFSEVLGIENVGIFDNFFELGGDSLKSIRVVSKLRRKNIEISMKDMLSLKTIANLSKVIRTQPNDSALGKVTEPGISISMFMPPAPTITVVNCDSVLEAVSRYRNNLLDKKVVKSYAPNFMQKGYIDFSESAELHPSGICFQVSGVSLSELKEALAKMVRDQGVLRTCLSEETGDLIEYEYGNWEIPHISADQALSREAVFTTLFSRKPKTGRDILPVILIAERPEGDFDVFFQTNHALWDRASCDIASDMLETYLKKKDQVLLPVVSFGDYVQSRNESENSVHTLEEKTFIRDQIRSYKARSDGSSEKRGFSVTIEKKEGVSYDISWMLSKYCEILKSDDINALPFFTLYHSRDERSMNTLGYYIDYVPGIFESATQKIRFYDETVRKLRTGNMDFRFLCDEYSEGICDDVLLVNILEFVDMQNQGALNEIKLAQVKQEVIYCALDEKTVTIDMAFNLKNVSDEEFIKRIKEVLGL